MGDFGVAGLTLVGGSGADILFQEFFDRRQEGDSIVLARQKMVLVVEIEGFDLLARVF